MNRFAEKSAVSDWTGVAHRAGATKRAGTVRFIIFPPMAAEITAAPVARFEALHRANRPGGVLVFRRSNGGWPVRSEVFIFASVSRLLPLAPPLKGAAASSKGGSTAPTRHWGPLRPRAV